MLIKENNSKGFTLVELAIVLIVIGLLIGMAFKGKALVDSAKVKADVVKVQKIATAFQVYQSKYDRMPGRKDDGTFTDQSIADELVKEGLITVGDLRFSVPPTNAHFIGCVQKAGTDLPSDKSWVNEFITDYSNICLYASTAPLSSKTNNKPEVMHVEQICYWETMVDNNYIFGGEGRKFGTSHAGFEPSFKDCAVFKGATKDIGNQPWNYRYSYRVYSNSI